MTENVQTGQITGNAVSDDINVIYWIFNIQLTGWSSLNRMNVVHWTFRFSVSTFMSARNLPRHFFRGWASMMTALIGLTLWKRKVLSYFRGSVIFLEVEYTRSDRIRFIVSQIQPVSQTLLASWSRLTLAACVCCVAVYGETVSHGSNTERFIFKIVCLLNMNDSPVHLL